MWTEPALLTKWLVVITRRATSCSSNAQSTDQLPGVLFSFLLSLTKIQRWMIPLVINKLIYIHAIRRSNNSVITTWLGCNGRLKQTDQLYSPVVPIRISNIQQWRQTMYIPFAIKEKSLYLAQHAIIYMTLNRWQYFPLSSLWNS